MVVRISSWSIAGMGYALPHTRMQCVSIHLPDQRAWSSSSPCVAVEEVVPQEHRNGFPTQSPVLSAVERDTSRNAEAGGNDKSLTLSTLCLTVNYDDYDDSGEVGIVVDASRIESTDWEGIWCLFNSTYIRAELKWNESRIVFALWKRTVSTVSNFNWKSGEIYCFLLANSNVEWIINVGILSPWSYVWINSNQI